MCTGLSPDLLELRMTCRWLSECCSSEAGQSLQRPALAVKFQALVIQFMHNCKHLLPWKNDAMLTVTPAAFTTNGARTRPTSTKLAAQDPMPIANSLPPQGTCHNTVSPSAAPADMLVPEGYVQSCATTKHLPPNVLHNVPIEKCPKCCLRLNHYREASDESLVWDSMPAVS